MATQQLTVQQPVAGKWYVYSGGAWQNMDMCTCLKKTFVLCLSSRLKSLTCILECNVTCIGIQDEEGNTPLHIAAIGKHTACVKELMVSIACITCIDYFIAVFRLVPYTLFRCCTALQFMCIRVHLLNLLLILYRSVLHTLMWLRSTRMESMLMSCWTKGCTSGHFVAKYGMLSCPIIVGGKVW